MGITIIDMRTSCSLGSLLSISDILACAKYLSKTRVDTVWIPETWGMECFSMLAAISNITTQNLGSSIVNIYSRSPSVIAMAAATVDKLSDGRFVLGLGTSSPPIVQDFHGIKFEQPLLRMQEYVEIIRLILAGGKINYTGNIFKLQNFKLLIKPHRHKIPIYLAAVNHNMINLTWKIADGTILYLRPKDEMRSMIKTQQSKRNIDVTCQIITSVSNDPEIADIRAKKTLAFYIAVGAIYRRFLADNGYNNVCTDIYSQYKESGTRSIHELISDSMLNDLCISGTPTECKEKLSSFRDTGIDMPILQFNPAGDIRESFEMFCSTFLEQ